MLVEFDFLPTVCEKHWNVAVLVYGGLQRVAMRGLV